MKVRKLAVALALAGGLGSGVAQALGLGEIELQSYLNEPLDAEIALPDSRGVNPADVFVNVAPEQAYERVGLDRNQFLSKLRFQVVTRNDGSLAVNVSSREPLREPYLNFLLEMTWPNGRLMREYAVLVDPPVYAEESGVQEQINVPAAASSETTRQPATARSQESLRRQARAERSLGSGYQADTFGPTGPSDTLWTIASRVRPNDNVSMQQVMLAIQDLNPDAFMGNNINRLKRGEVLRIPSIDQIQSAPVLRRPALSVSRIRNSSLPSVQWTQRLASGSNLRLRKRPLVVMSSNWSSPRSLAAIRPRAVPRVVTVSFRGVLTPAPQLQWKSWKVPGAKTPSSTAGLKTCSLRSRPFSV